MGNYDMQALSVYYQSPAWAAKRNERLRIDGYRCAKCGFTRALEVHHINYERVFHEDVSRDLITLCKKCHNEIEAQKKIINPFKVPTEHHSVYLAGKIRMNDWRNKFTNYRDAIGDPENIANGCEVEVGKCLTITGPFFISCDHGCYHGDGTHGVGADCKGEYEDDDGGIYTREGCMGFYFTREDVLKISKSQINKAEIVFAYIDCRDCFGTIAEIGYAHAIGKDIFIIFSCPELKEEMWFIDKMQRNTGIASSEWIEKQLTSRFKEA